MESKGTTVVASCIHQALTDSHRYTTLTDATLVVFFIADKNADTYGRFDVKYGVFCRWLFSFWGEINNPTA